LETTPNRLSETQALELRDSYREAGLTHPTAVEQQRLAREDLLQNQEIQNAFQTFYRRKNGQPFDGTQDELIDEYMEQMRFYDTNIASIGGLAAELQADYYTEEERQALGVMWGAWENVVPFTQQENGKWEAIWDYTEAAATDPSNWAGLFTGGTAVAGGLAAKQVAKAGVKKLLLEGLKQGGIEGIKQGAVWSAAQSVAAVSKAIQDATPENPLKGEERATMSVAEAAEDYVNALADSNVTGEARVAARNSFLQTMGKAIQREGAGVKKTNDQLLQEGTEALQKIGVKTFEPDEVLDKLITANRKNSFGMDQDQFGRLVVETENFMWNRFKESWKKGGKESAEKFWENFEKASALSEGIGTQAGRALQVRKLRARTDPISFGEALEHIANRVDTLDEARLAAKKASEKAGVWRKMGAGLNEFFINNILGSPVTLAINTSSGYVHGWDRSLTAMAAGVKNGNMKLFREGATRAVMTHYYMGQGLRYALRAFAKGEAILDKGRNFADDAASDNIRIGDRNFDLAQPSSLLKQNNESVGMYVANIVGNVNRLIGGRGMVATDELLKQMNFRSRLFQIELDDALARGQDFPTALRDAQKATALKTDEYIEAVGMGIEVSDPKMKAALEEAREVTFQTDFKDDFIGQLGAGTQKVVNQYGVLRQIMPFIRTPTNILSYVGEKTPLLQNTSRSFKERLSSPNPQIRQKAEMSMTLGTMLWASGFALAASGSITGAGSPDYARRSVDMSSNEFLPYSVDTGDKLVSIRRYDPWAKFFLVMGGINDVMKYGSDKEQTALFAKVALATAESIFAMPSLTGLQSLLQVANNPEKGMDQFLGRQAQSFVPYYRLVTDIMEASGQDKVVFESFGISDFADDPALAFETQWPFLGNIDKIDRRRDPIFGTPVVREPHLGTTISGLAYKEGSDNAVLEELTRLGIGAQRPSPIQYGQVDMRQFPVDPKFQRTVYDLYQENVGTVEIAGSTLYDALERTIKSDYYLNTLTDNYAIVGRGETTGSREKELDSLISQYRTKALSDTIDQLKELDPNHPYVLQYQQAPIIRDLSQTQQTQRMTDEILGNMFGPLGNNQ